MCATSLKPKGYRSMRVIYVCNIKSEEYMCATSLKSEEYMCATSRKSEAYMCSTSLKSEEQGSGMHNTLILLVNFFNSIYKQEQLFQNSDHNC